MARFLVEVNSPLVSAYGIQHVKDYLKMKKMAFGNWFGIPKLMLKPLGKFGTQMKMSSHGQKKQLRFFLAMAKIKFSFDAYIARANDTFGEFEPSSFVSEYYQCLYKEGKEGQRS